MTNTNNDKKFCPHASTGAICKFDICLKCRKGLDLIPKIEKPRKAFIFCQRAKYLNIPGWENKVIDFFDLPCDVWLDDGTKNTLPKNVEFCVFKQSNGKLRITTQDYCKSSDKENYDDSNFSDVEKYQYTDIHVVLDQKCFPSDIDGWKRYKQSKVSPLDNDKFPYIIYDNIVVRYDKQLVREQSELIFKIMGKH